MQTFTGRQFWPLDPRPEEIFLEDIAHSLSQQCRFAGHCTEFYSVAQHSVLVAGILPPDLRAWGLMHDASEAYLVDLPRPTKQRSRLGTEYRIIEARVMAAVCERFHLPVTEPPEIKEADNILLMTEKRDLMPNSPAPWAETEAPMDWLIKPWKPSVAKRIFLQTAEVYLLGGGK